MATHAGGDPSVGEPFAAGYAQFRDEAFTSTSVVAAYLATIRAQADALALVWEAHGRGAVTLPPRVAAAVCAARLAAG